MSLIFLIPDEDTKPYIPNFPKFAGGFADRLKGLLFALEWAESAQVPLQVYWRSPLALTSIFNLKGEQIQNLTLNEALERISGGNSEVRFINWVDLGADEIKQKMRSIYLHDNAKTYVLFANQFNADTERERQKGLNLLFNKHLEFNENIRKRAQAICPLLSHRSPDKPLLGMQLRIGKHVGAGWNDPFLDSKLNWRLMRKIAKKFSINSHHFVFLSDAARLQYGEKGLKKFRPRWSSENVHFELSKNTRDEQLLDTVAQFYLLSQCTHVVYGKGEFGYLAAVLGGGKCVDYYTELSDWGKKLHKWNHRLSRWRISLAKRLTPQVFN